MDCTFVEQSHQYFHGPDGEELPSVTRILDDFKDSQWYGPGVALRGTYVHKICHLHNINDLDESTIDEALTGYYEAYKKFLAESGFKVYESEILVHSDLYRFAGTLDLRGQFPKSPLKSIVDIKSGSIEPWHGLQTAGYAVCYTEPHERYVLQLTAEGKYHLKQWSDRSDKTVFLGSVAVWHWRHQHLRGHK